MQRRLLFTVGQVLWPFEVISVLLLNIYDKPQTITEGLMAAKCILYSAHDSFEQLMNYLSQLAYCI